MMPVHGRDSRSPSRKDINKGRTARVLLVYPPPASPALPPLVAGLAAAWLQIPGIRVEGYDANLNMFRRLACGPADIGSGTVAADYPAAFQALTEASDFFSPRRHLTGLRRVRRVTGVGPQWRADFRDPASAAEARSLSGIWERGLTRRLETDPPDIVVLTIDNRAQIETTRNMTAWLKERFSDLPVALLTGRTAAVDIETDAIQSGCNPRPLLKRLIEFDSTTIPPPAELPDFGPFLSPGEYLSPQPVLPLSLTEGERSNVALDTLIEEYVGRYNGRALWVADTALSLAILAVAGKSSLPCPASLILAANHGFDRKTLSAAAKGNVRLIRWQISSAADDSVRQMLWDSARAGIWNHLLLGSCADPEWVGFARANPNIAHSIESAGPANTACGYGRTVPIPGRPYWQAIDEPAHLLLQIVRHGVPKVRCWRVPEEDARVYRLGTDIHYHFSPPDRLPPGYLEEIVRMVEAGGSVGTRWVRYNLERAFLIAYAVENGMIVGNSSLKHPRKEYVRRVSSQSGVDLSRFLERGYTSVRPEYRGLGIGTRLLKGLTARTGGRDLFSVIGADNAATQTIARRNRTCRVAEFFSQTLGKRVGIWVPEETAAKLSICTQVGTGDRSNPG